MIGRVGWDERLCDFIAFGRLGKHYDWKRLGVESVPRWSFNVDKGLQRGQGATFLLSIPRAGINLFISLPRSMRLALLTCSNLGVSGSLCARTLIVRTRIGY